MKWREKKWWLVTFRLCVCHCFHFTSLTLNMQRLRPPIWNQLNKGTINQGTLWSYIVVYTLHTCESNNISFIHICRLFTEEHHGSHIMFKARQGSSFFKKADHSSSSLRNIFIPLCSSCNQNISKERGVYVCVKKVCFFCQNH